MRCTRRRDPHHFTILHGTPFGTKRKLSVRALLLAIRAFAVTHRSISARELARELGVNHVSLWRHLHTLRALMRKVPLIPTKLAGVARLSDTSGVRCGGRSALARDKPAPSGKLGRVVAECVRTWINGTFHGVSDGWLPLYLREIGSRWTYDKDILVEEMLTSLIGRAPPIGFARARLVATE